MIIPAISTKLNRTAILELFGGNQPFVEYHFRTNKLDNIANLIIE